MDFKYHFQVVSESLKILSSDSHAEQEFIADHGPWVANDVFDFEILDWLPALEHYGLISNQLFIGITSLYKEIDEFTALLSDGEEEQLLLSDIEPVRSWRMRSKVLLLQVEVKRQEYTEVVGP